MPADRPVDRIERAFQEGKPITDALKKAAKLAKREHDVRGSARNRLLALGRKARIGEVIEPQVSAGTPNGIVLDAYLFMELRPLRTKRDYTTALKGAEALWDAPLAQRKRWCC